MTKIPRLHVFQRCLTLACLGHLEHDHCRPRYFRVFYVTLFLALLFVFNFGIFSPVNYALLTDDRQPTIFN